MAGFKQEPDYDFLEGKELSQIQVNPYNVLFTFVEGPVIDVEKAFEHVCAVTGHKARFNAQGTPKEFTVHALLGLRITDVEIVSDDELKLVFENGDELHLLRHYDGYEAMTIGGHPEGLIVIM